MTTDHPSFDRATTGGTGVEVGPPSADRSPPPRRRRRWRRLAVVPALLAALLVGQLAASGAADAAAYDARGRLITPTGATAQVGAICGPYGLKLSFNHGTNGVPGNYYTYAVRPQGARDWAVYPWAPVPRIGVNQFTVTSLRGNWEVVAWLAHQRNGTWYYDAEYTNVSNEHPLYSGSGWCHVGF